ncbi:MAG: hypothetical protein NTX72_05635 [Candidatus Uhrbacteria bacterium]|nr:hypothetical protein [Candidatus Uhrbacteria bacterium]
MFSFTKASPNKAPSLPAGRNKTPLRSPLDLVFLSLQLYRSNFWLMIGYTAWLLLPFAGYFVLSFFPEQNPIVVTLDLLCSVAEFMITFWTGIILILIVNALVEKQPFDAMGLKKYSKTLLQPTARVLLLHILLVLLGFILLIIPGFIAIIWFAFAQTSAVLDGKHGMEALKFSRSLSEGRFFSVLYRLVGGPVLIGFVYSVIVALIISISGAAAGVDPVKIAAQNQLPAWLDLLQSIVEIVAIPLLATYMTLLYKHLRETRGPLVKQETVSPETGEKIASSMTPRNET